VVDRSEIVDGRGIQEGDILLGLRSDGLHTNGYTLARKVLLEGRDMQDTYEGLEMCIGRELLRVHRSYYSVLSPLLDDPAIHGLAHITGGGLVDNVARLIPEGLADEIDWDAWERPRLFKLIQEFGPVPEDDMRHTFNLGIGFVIVAAADGAEALKAKLSAAGEDPIAIGQVVPAGQ